MPIKTTYQRGFSFETVSFLTFDSVNITSLRHEAQRSLTKILQATNHKSESNNNLLSALLTSHMLHISMNLKMAYKQVFFHFHNLTLYNKILPLLHFGTQN